jgi:hypothetical protein
MGTGSSPEIKRLGRDVDHPPASRAEVKEKVDYTSAPPLCLRSMLQFKVYLLNTMFQRGKYEWESLIRESLNAVLSSHDICASVSKQLENNASEDPCLHAFFYLILCMYHGVTRRLFQARSVNQNKKGGEEIIYEKQ